MQIKTASVSAAASVSHWPRVMRVALEGQERQLGVGGSAQTRKTGDHAFFQHVQNMQQIIYKMLAAVW